MVDVLVEFEYEGQEDDELSIKVGEIITNVKKMDGGWWEGVLNGKRGVFPDNFVKEIKKQDAPAPVAAKKAIPPQTSSPKTGPQTGTPKAHVAELANKLGNINVNPTSNAVKKPAEKGGGRGKTRVKVTFAYNPVNEDELRLEVGEVFELLKQEEEGWWEGNLNGKIGVFPSNFVEIVESSEDTEAPAVDGGINEIKGKKIMGVGLGKNIFGDDGPRLRKTPEQPRAPEMKPDPVPDARTSSMEKKAPVKKVMPVQPEKAVAAPTLPPKENKSVDGWGDIEYQVRQVSPVKPANPRFNPMHGDYVPVSPFDDGRQSQDESQNDLQYESDDILAELSTDFSTDSNFNGSSQMTDELSEQQGDESGKWIIVGQSKQRPVYSPGMSNVIYKKKCQAQLRLSPLVLFGPIHPEEPPGIIFDKSGAPSVGSPPTEATEESLQKRVSFSSEDVKPCNLPVYCHKAVQTDCDHEANELLPAIRASVSLNMMPENITDSVKLTRTRQSLMQSHSLTAQHNSQGVQVDLTESPGSNPRKKIFFETGTPAKESASDNSLFSSKLKPKRTSSLSKLASQLFGAISTRSNQGKGSTRIFNRANPFDASSNAEGDHKTQIATDQSESQHKGSPVSIHSYEQSPYHGHKKIPALTDFDDLPQNCKCCQTEESTPVKRAKPVPAPRSSQSRKLNGSDVFCPEVKESVVSASSLESTPVKRAKPVPAPRSSPSRKLNGSDVFCPEVKESVVSASSLFTKNDAESGENVNILRLEAKDIPEEIEAATSRLVKEDIGEVAYTEVSQQDVKQMKDVRMCALPEGITKVAEESTPSLVKVKEVVQRSRNPLQENTGKVGSRLITKQAVEHARTDTSCFAAKAAEHSLVPHTESTTPTKKPAITSLGDIAVTLPWSHQLRHPVNVAVADSMSSSENVFTDDTEKSIPSDVENPVPVNPQVDDDTQAPHKNVRLLSFLKSNVHLPKIRLLRRHSTSKGRKAEDMAKPAVPPVPREPISPLPNQACFQSTEQVPTTDHTYFSHLQSQGRMSPTISNIYQKYHISPEGRMTCISYSRDRIPRRSLSLNSIASSDKVPHASSDLPSEDVQPNTAAHGEKLKRKGSTLSRVFSLRRRKNNSFGGADKSHVMATLFRRGSRKTPKAEKVALAAASDEGLESKENLPEKKPSIFRKLSMRYRSKNPKVQKTQSSAKEMIDASQNVNVDPEVISSALDSSISLDMPEESAVVQEEKNDTKLSLAPKVHIQPSEGRNIQPTTSFPKRSYPPPDNYPTFITPDSPKNVFLSDDDFHMVVKPFKRSSDCVSSSRSQPVCAARPRKSTDAKPMIEPMKSRSSSADISKPSCTLDQALCQGEGASIVPPLLMRPKSPVVGSGGEGVGSLYAASFPSKNEQEECADSINIKESKPDELQSMAPSSTEQEDPDLPEYAVLKSTAATMMTSADSKYTFAKSLLEDPSHVPEDFVSNTPVMGTIQEDPIGELSPVTSDIDISQLMANKTQNALSFYSITTAELSPTSTVSISSPPNEMQTTDSVTYPVLH